MVQLLVMVILIFKDILRNDFCQKAQNVDPDFSGGPKHIRLTIGPAMEIPVKNSWYEFGDGDIK